MTLEEYAKGKGLELRKVTRGVFLSLARQPAFPFDNPKHTFLRRPFIKEADFTAAVDVTGTLLYYTKEAKPRKKRKANRYECDTPGGRVGGAATLYFPR